MNEVSIDVMPAVVWELYEFLLDETEVSPSVNRNGHRKIILTHQNDRVRVVVNFHNPGWRWSWKSSLLFIDGRRESIASSPDHYVAIFNDPDEGRYGYTPEGSKKTKLPDMKEVSEGQLPYAPHLVSSMAKNLKSGVTDKNAEVKVYIAEKSNRYIISVENPEKGDVYQIIGKGGAPGSKGGGWGLVDIILTNTRGYDVTKENAHRIEEILRDLLGADSRKNQKPYIPEGSTRSQAGMSNSVAVRKATVFRV